MAPFALPFQRSFQITLMSSIDWAIGVEPFAVMPALLGVDVITPVPSVASAYPVGVPSPLSTNSGRRKPAIRLSCVGEVWSHGRSATSAVNPLHPAPPKLPPDQIQVTVPVTLPVGFVQSLTVFTRKLGGFVFAVAVDWSTWQTVPLFT